MHRSELARVTSTNLLFSTLDLQKLCKEKFSTTTTSSLAILIVNSNMEQNVCDCVKKCSLPSD